MSRPISFSCRLGASLLVVMLGSHHVVAQEHNVATNSKSMSAVTAAASGARVRFTASSTVVQMRLEIYALTGEKLVDNEIRGGNVIDWHLRDGQAERLSDGSYLCVITGKSLSGRLSQKLGRITIENAAASVQAFDATQLSAQQTQAVGPLEENASLTVLKEGDNQTATVISHNGDEGQITRGRGALSFRIGDFFRGKDIEQMRLTPEGNLGIGLTQPRAKLDVDGLIRSSQGIVFPDGSVQYSAARKTFGGGSLMPGDSQGVLGQDAAVPDTTGTGTTGKITRWLDGPNGVLGDSNITESSGAVGINGTPDTRFRLDVNGSTRLRGSNPGFNLEGLRAAGNIWVFQTVDDDGRFRLFSQDNVNPGVERLTIGLSTGNVGIGTPTPGQKLTVAGTIESTSGGFKFPDGTVQMTAGGGGGGGSITGVTAGTGLSGGGTSGNVTLNIANAGVGTAQLADGSVSSAKLATNLNLNGQLEVDHSGTNNGTVNPGLTFGAGSGEGIASKRTAGGNLFGLDFFTGFTSRMSITNAGNVGIGTTTPGFPLTFANTLGDKISLWGQSGNHYGFGVQGALLQIHADNSGSDIAFGQGRSAAFTETMRIKGNGNVGIGTTNPDRNVTVERSGGAFINARDTIGATEVLLGADGNGGIVSTMTNHDLQLRAGGNSTKMIIKADGNVGIGTINPIAKLDVATSAGNSVRGIATSGNGVLGLSDSGKGVSGASTSGYGVIGATETGTGVYGDNGNSNTTGHAGYFNGRVTMTGNLEANNLPGVGFSQGCPTSGSADCLPAISGVPAGESFNVDTLTINVPAPGFIFITAFAQINGFLATGGSQVEFNLFQCNDANCGGGNYLMRSNNTILRSPVHISWVLPVNAPGPITLRTNGTNNNSSASLFVVGHNLSLVYLPKQY